MSISLLRQLLMKEAVKKSAGASGIMTINKGIAADVEKLVQKYVNDALAQGVDLDTLSESQLKYIIELNKPKTPKVFFGQEAADQLNKLFPKKGEVIPLPMKRTFKQEIEAMKKSGDLVDEDNMVISKKITDRDMFKKANEKFQKPIKEKQNMGEFGEINVETDYSTSINRPEFFDPKAKNMYGKTVKIGVEFIEKEKERILNTINRKKKEMVPRTHSNYKLLKKSLQDQEDALEAIKITEDLGGNENMFDFLRTQNISDYSSKPLKRSNYVKTDAEIKAEIEAGNKKGIEAIKKGKLDDDPENMATGGRAGYAVGNQVTPQVDARMNLDYNTLINQNEAQRVTQAQNRNPGIMRPTMADVAGAVQTDPRAGIKEAFLNERLSGGERFGDAIPDFDSYGTYTGSDQLLKDYAAAGRGTPSSQLVRLPEGNPYAYGGPGYYEYDGSSFSKTADLNMTPEYEKMIRSNYNLNQINQNTVPRKITQDDIDTANFFGPMYTGFDYSQSTDWSPGQPAPDGYRVVDMMGDQFLERMYPSKEEVAGLPGMMGPLPLGLMMPPSSNYQDPDAGLSGQEYAEKYNIPYAKGGRAGHYTGGMVDVEPNLSDIGHGSDALMARTRLVSPDGQATTSTGLNYLLAEDNDNIRVPFKDGLKVYPKIMASKSNEGLGDGKNVDLQDLTYGGTLMYDKGPLSAGIEYLKGKDKFDFKNKDDTLFKDTTDRELANLILMMKLKNGLIKFKGNKDNQMINFSKSFADGGRIGFSKGKAVAKGLDYLMDLFKPKPKVIFDEKRFREGPINLDFLENIDKKDLEPFIRSRDTMGPGGYGMYDDFADMPSGLQAAELISRIKGPRNTINYEAAEMFIGKKLKGNESVDELIEMLIEKKAEGGRIGFSKGKGVDLLRRGFLKTMGAAGAGIAALKTGLLGLGGKQATKEVAKEIITTPAAAGKPAWFDALVTRVVNEGEDVTKKFATKDREIVHATKVDDDAMVTVYRDLDDGTVRVDIDDATTNVMGEQGDSVVSLQVKGGQLEEGVKGKTPVEFEAVEADYRNYTTSPDGDYDTEVVENVVNNTKDLTADLTKLKIYARGDNKPTMKELVESKKRQTKLEQAAKDPADYASDRGPQFDLPDPEPDDFASGGLAGMLGE